MDCLKASEKISNKSLKTLHTILPLKSVSGTKRSLNLLLIDNSAMGYMQEQFGRFLHDRGYNIKWIFMSSDEMRSRKSYKYGSAEVVLSPMMPSRGRLSTLINYCYYKPFMSLLLPRMIKSRKIDIVFVRNDVRIAFLSYLLCKIKQIPFVYYLAYPLLESHLLSVRQGNRPNRLINELAAIVGIPLRNWVTRKADFVFTMSDYWAKKIVNELRLPARKVMSLPAGFDATIPPESVDGINVRRHFNLADYPTLFYMGTMSPPRDSTILTEIIAQVVQRIPEARLLILCGHDQIKYLPVFRQGLIENGVEKNVVFASPVTHQQVSMYIKASHVGLSPIEIIPLFNVSSPHKFVEMLGMECPVVASETPDQKYVLNKSGGGICVPYNAGAFAEAVVYLLRNPDKAREMGKHGRAFVERERSYDVLAGRIDKVLRQLV